MNNADDVQIARADFDAALKALDANRHRWVQTTTAQRIEWLARIKACLMPVAEAWAEAAARAKGIDPASPLAGEEWMSGPYAVMAYCNSMMSTLKDVAGNRHLDGVPLRTRAGGQLVAKVFPHSLWDRLLLSGVTAEVWMQPGVTERNLSQYTASSYWKPATEGKVALVLGAGNIAAIAPLDGLHKLFVDNEVVILKMNPVNEYLTEFLEPALAPLIEQGFLRIVRGDIAAGTYLCNHPLVSTLHITGSGAAHDKIVWGSGGEAAANKRAGTPINARPMTAELGGVGPTIVVPGPWTDADIAFQAEHIATQKLHNAGFNCIACQVLVLPRSWPRKPAFIEQVRRTIAATTPRPVYYPGAASRLTGFAEAFDGPDSAVPRHTAECIVAPFEAGVHHPVESTEVFAPALAVTELAGDDAEAFLVAAVAYANEHLEGTLGANILIHPATRKQIGSERFEAIIAELRYGCIAINAWTGLGFLLAPLTWGAFPGHTPENVQSGIGVVHNTLMFDRPQRTVVEAPFRPFPRNLASGSFSLLPRPPWFVTNRRSQVIGKLLTRFEFAPSLAKLPRIFFNALAG